jgi:hypothetical protein
MRLALQNGSNMFLRNVGLFQATRRNNTEGGTLRSHRCDDVSCPGRRHKRIWSFTTSSGTWDSAVGIASGYGLNCLGVGSSSTGRVKDFLHTASRPVLRPTEAPVQWAPGALSPGGNGWGVKLTIRLQIVPGSGKRGSIHPLPHTPSWRSA